jgi:uncharacterized protein (TIGR02588 family)
MSDDGQTEGGENGPPPRQVARLEWIVAGLGALLAAGVLGVLVQEALTYEEGPPVIVAAIEDVTRTEAGHVVRFTAQNRGDTTAAEVTMAATLKEGDRVVEEAEVTLDYVARKSSRKAGVVFERDPASATIEIKARSFRKP